MDLLVVVEGAEFHNLLADPRIQNHLAWALKPFSPKSRSSGTQHLLHRYKTLKNEDINELMQKEFPNENVCHRFYKLNSILSEIGFAKNIAVVRCLGYVLIKIMKKILSSILINEKRFLELRSNMGRNPVIFLPTHRSYADFILMAFLCFNYDIEIPVVVAGVDFYGMFGMATVLRQCGAMYMRRSFKNDKIYGTVFKTYVQSVIATGNSPFEFFIEGTRSRTGKSLFPKLGLLKSVVNVYTSKQVADITLVPISINYDRLMEDNLFAKEVIGVPKPKESTKGLLRGISLLEQSYGSIYINVGNEISLKQFEKCLSPCDDILVHLANSVVRRQQENVVITFPNLLCAALLCGLLSERRNIVSFNFLCGIIVQLQQALTIAGAFLASFGNVEKGIEYTLKVHKFIELDKKTMCIHISPYSKTNENVLQNATTVIMLQHYANPCYHFLVNPAIIFSILYSKKSVNKAVLFDQFKICRTVFKHEFLLFEGEQYQDFESALVLLEKLQLIEPHNNITIVPGASETTIAWRYLLIPYYRGYLFICRSLLQIGDHLIDGSSFKSRIKRQLELELDTFDEISPYYSFSSNLLSCALSSLNDAKIIHFKSFSEHILVVDVLQLNIIVDFLKLRLNDDLEEIPSINSISCKL